MVPNMLLAYCRVVRKLKHFSSERLFQNRSLTGLQKCTVLASFSDLKKNQNNMNGRPSIKTGKLYLAEYGKRSFLQLLTRVKKLLKVCWNEMNGG